MKFQLWCPETKTMSKITRQVFHNPGVGYYFSDYNNSHRNCVLRVMFGFPDIDGKPIFSGDIVKDRYGEIGLVKYGVHKGTFWHYGFYYLWTTDEEDGWNQHGSMISDSDVYDGELYEYTPQCKLKVIGNEYQNPELIAHIKQH